MTVVPTPDELGYGWHGVVRPSMSNGSAHTLPMTDEEKKAVADRVRDGFGFGVHHGTGPYGKAKTKRRRKPKP